MTWMPPFPITWPPPPTWTPVPSSPYALQYIHVLKWSSPVPHSVSATSCPLCLVVQPASLPAWTLPEWADLVLLRFACFWARVRSSTGTNGLCAGKSEVLRSEQTQTSDLSSNRPYYIVWSTSTHTVQLEVNQGLWGKKKTFHSGSFIWVLVTCHARRLEILAKQNVKTCHISGSVTWVKHNGCVRAVFPLCSWQFGTHEKIRGTISPDCALLFASIMCCFEKDLLAADIWEPPLQFHGRPPRLAFCRCRVLFGAPRFKLYCFHLSKQQYKHSKGGTSMNTLLLTSLASYFCHAVWWMAAALCQWSGIFVFFALVCTCLVFWWHAESLTEPDWRQKVPVEEKGLASVSTGWPTFVLTWTRSVAWTRSKSHLFQPWSAQSD